MMDDGVCGQYYVECFVCGSNVIYFCVQCNEDFCKICEEQYKIYDVFIYREKYVIIYLEKCFIYLQESYFFFCRECEVLFCEFCVQSFGYLGYLFVDIKMVYDEYCQNYR